MCALKYIQLLQICNFFCGERLESENADKRENEPGTEGGGSHHGASPPLYSIIHHHHQRRLIRNALSYMRVEWVFIV